MSKVLRHPASPGETRQTETWSSSNADAALRDEMLFRSGLGASGLRMTFDTFEPLKGKTPALNICRAWTMDREGSGLLLYGPAGSGKTHLACAIVNKAIRQWGVFAKLLSAVRIPKDDTDAVNQLSDPDEVPLLVLDDLGAEKGTERALECLYSIIDGRSWRRAHLIVTTNFKPADLASLWGRGYGERLASRLTQSCGEVIPVGGDDMRRAGR